MEEQQTSIMTKIRESLRLLTRHLDQRPGRVVENRAEGVAQRRPLNQVRECTVGFAQRQLGTQIVVGRHPTNCADSEELEPDFRSYDNLPKLSGYEYFEDI